MFYSVKSLDHRLLLSVCQMTNEQPWKEQQQKADTRRRSSAHQGHLGSRPPDSESFSVPGAAPGRCCDRVLRASKDWLQPLLSELEGGVRYNTLPSI